MFIETANNLAPSSPTIPTSLGVALVTGFVLHLLKVWAKIPWIDFYTTKLNTILRLVLSAIGTLGVSLKWAAATGGGGTLAITIPTLAVIIAGLWHWAIQYVTQYSSECVYQIATQQVAAAKPPVKA